MSNEGEFPQDTQAYQSETELGFVRGEAGTFIGLRIHAGEKVITLVLNCQQAADIAQGLDEMIAIIQAEAEAATATKH